MTTLSGFVVLFCIATAVAVVVRRSQVPYTVVLMVVGLVLGSIGAVDPPHLTRDLLFTAFLPGLLFEAAFHIDMAVFRKTWMAITGLAIPGVIAAIAITSAVLIAALRGSGVVPDFAWDTALIFAALIAATDPVAVTALFRQLSAPAELLVLVEGESLLNDGTAVVFLSLILAYVSGVSATATQLVWEFVVVAGGGALVGLIVGIVVTQIIRRVDDAMIEITLTTIAAYGSFVLAENFHVSGVIATVVAGMLCGNYGRRVAMSPTTRAAVESFWEYIAFALNSMVFLLLGFEVSFTSLLSSWREIAIAYVVVVMTRAIVVFSGRAIALAIRRDRRPTPPASWSVVLTWGGLRGALSLVLALALSGTLPHRELVVRMTAGVVVLSLLVQGLTMAPLIRRLGLSIDHAAGHPADAARVHAGQ